MVSTWRTDTKDTLLADTINVFCSSEGGVCTYPGGAILAESEWLMPDPDLMSLTARGGAEGQTPEHGG
jgi:hypothetical protein